jgi:hypothetical protein
MIMVTSKSQQNTRPAMIYHAINEALRFGHDPLPLLCLHAQDNPNVGTSEPPQRPVTPPTG